MGVKFIEAIPLGADLTKIPSQFLASKLDDPIDGAIAYCVSRLRKLKRSDRDDTAKAIQNVATLFRQSCTGASNLPGSPAEHSGSA
jgi:hypothetical protein